MSNNLDVETLHREIQNLKDRLSQEKSEKESLVADVARLSFALQETKSKIPSVSAPQIYSDFKIIVKDFTPDEYMHWKESVKATNPEENVQYILGLYNELLATTHEKDMLVDKVKQLTTRINELELQNSSLITLSPLVLHEMDIKLKEAEKQLSLGKCELAEERKKRCSAESQFRLQSQISDGLRRDLQGLTDEMEVEKLAYEVKEQLHKVTAELQDERSKRKTAEIEKNAECRAAENF